MTEEKQNTLIVPDSMIVTTEARKDKKRLSEIYKKKLVDTGKNNEIPDKIDRAFDVHAKVVKYLCHGATVLLAICPFDGPFGEVLMFLATPFLEKGVKVQDKILAKGTKKIFKKVDAAFIKDGKKAKKMKLKDKEIIDFKKIDNKDLEKSYGGISNAA